jgi:hypothetical protein
MVSRRTPGCPKLSCSSPRGPLGVQLRLHTQQSRSLGSSTTPGSCRSSLLSYLALAQTRHRRSKCAMIKCVTFDSGWAQWCWYWCWCWLLGEWRFLFQLTPSRATSLSVRQRGTCGIGEGIPNVGMAVVVRFGLLCFSEAFYSGLTRDD